MLKATALLTPQRVDTYNDLSLANNATYYVDLPSDYLHLLNCICIYQVNKTYKCYNAGDTWRAAATRLTADTYSQVLDNFWLKPTYKRPYYYIHNINTQDTIPTNPYDNTGHGTDISNISNISNSNINYGKDGNKANIVQGTGIPKTIDIKISGNNLPYSNIERGQSIRYGNVSKVRMEIRYGTDDTVFTLGHSTVEGKTDLTGKIYIDYIKAPLYIRLTQEELDHTEDYSLMLEFPDYVCQEILNELVHIAMEHISDPRLQTHPVVSLSIANPAQALTPQAQGLSAQQ